MSRTYPENHPDLNSVQAINALGWDESDRALQFTDWLSTLVHSHGLLIDTVKSASADASFRRYFRIHSASRSFILMDAPPDKENCQPFADISQLMLNAGLRVPRVLDWHVTHGFMLLDDMGRQTMMQYFANAGTAQRLLCLSKRPMRWWHGNNLPCQGYFLHTMKHCCATSFHFSSSGTSTVTGN